ncbi:MAG: S-layer homology domain-containing protein [Actinomyces sp.]|nr:MAG: S-layer homology domain-containing protein [Actinomyces sp.]
MPAGRDSSYGRGDRPATRPGGGTMTSQPTRARRRPRRSRSFAAGLIIGSLVAGGVAAASVSFDDVPTGKFYEAPAEWAKANGITTGSPAGSRTFKPEDPVTRGESVTFLKRYDDAIVQPALADTLATLTCANGQIAYLSGSTWSCGVLTVSTPSGGGSPTITIQPAP